MREFKFRAWDKETQSMFVPWSYKFSEPDKYVLMQYTGLKDKNGKEIYEGDIVKISDHPFEGAVSVNGNYEVGYNSEMELCCGSWLLFRMKHYAEVIGNIYENPKLMEERS